MTGFFKVLDFDMELLVMAFEILVMTLRKLEGRFHRLNLAVESNWIDHFGAPLYVEVVG